MELIAQMKQVQVGDLIEVWSTDAGSAADIPEWIKKVGHEVHIQHTERRRVAGIGSQNKIEGLGERRIVGALMFNLKGDA